MFGLIHFYDECSEQYAELTVKADMSKQYVKFMAYLPSGANVVWKEKLCQLQISHI